MSDDDYEPPMDTVFDREEEARGYMPVEPLSEFDGPCGEDGGCAVVPGCRCPFTIEPPSDSEREKGWNL